MSARLLLADDDVVLADLLSEYLQGEGMSVDIVNDGIAALDASTKPYDLMVFDIMMPGMTGLDVLKEIRARSIHTPVIMLTARGDDVDRILGLELGADDYMPKPCNPRELLARVNAILRRSQQHDQSAASDVREITLGSLCLDLQNMQAMLDSKPLLLTQTEFDFLHLLVGGDLVTKETFSEQVLGRKLGLYDRSIDVHISNLRKKLSIDKGLEIQTVRGRGYHLKVISG